MCCYARLRDSREDKDLTQKDVARILMTTQQQYSKYETGVQEIPVRHIMTLAVFYNTSVDFIVGRTNNPSPPAK